MKLYRLRNKTALPPEATLFWFEPYELPTEEEIQTAIEKGIFEIPHENQPWIALVSTHIIKAAITNLLKGER